MRSSPLIEYCSTVLLLCLWLGAITTIFSSLVGLFQQDLKKVIAFSTMSQLARIYNKIIVIIYRNQAVCDKLIPIFYYTLMTLLLIVNYYLISVLINQIITLVDYNLYFDQYIACSADIPLSLALDFQGASISYDLRTIHCGRDSSSSNKKLNPYYITGFVDGEGCFLINVQRRSYLKLGYSVSLMFKILLHPRDKELLEKIQIFFKVGNIYTRKEGHVEYVVSSLKDIEVIINHFDSYPLITHKWSDYQLFRQTFELIKRKEHLTIEGLKKVLSFKAVFNEGLPNQLKTAFPDIIPHIRPPKEVMGELIKDPHWISGFVDGEGCFYVSLYKDSTKVKSLWFQITQHTRDLDLLKELITYFNCGRYSTYGKKYANFVVTRISDINMKIIPFFKKYPLQGDKYKSFASFEQIAHLMVNKTHLTAEGLQQIKQIKSGMNKTIKNNLSTNPLQKCSQKRTYGTMPAYHLSSCCQVNSYYSFIKLNKADLLITKRELKYGNYRNWPDTSGGNRISKGIRFYCTPRAPEAFYEWLAGLIDGKGKIFKSKKGYANFQIVMPKQDKYALYTLKNKYGGSIKSRAASSTKLRYKLHHKKGLISLVNDVNGLIRNPSRMLELNKVCLLYNIEFKEPKPLTLNNGWFSGLIDSEGFIHIDEKSGQLIISVTLNNNYLLEPLQKFYGGRIRITSTKNAFIYSIYRKKEILNLVEDYFKKYPLRSSKRYKLNLIPEFYKIYTVALLPLDNFKKWVDFKNEWFWAGQGRLKVSYKK